jgi:hypothetical protein
MATLSVDTDRFKVLGAVSAYPVIADDIVYEGAAVGLVKATGHAQPLAAANLFCGFAERKADNTGGAAAAINVRVVTEGVVKLSISGAVITDVGQPVYATDDNTFVFSPVGGVFIGKVTRFVSSGVVEVTYDAALGIDPYAGMLAEAIPASPATRSILAADTGKILVFSATNVVSLGLSAIHSFVKLLNIAPYGTAQLTLTPVTASPAEGFNGADLAGTVGKSRINTLATAQRGDYSLIKGGQTVMNTIHEEKGTWAQEA